MSNLLFFTHCNYVTSLKLESFFTIEELCKIAGIPCRASGSWINRKVEIRRFSPNDNTSANSNLLKSLKIEAEPGDWGSVRITIEKDNKKNEARMALLILAYVLHDLVAKQSVAGYPWAKIPPPRGRIKTGKAMTNSERQRLFRLRKFKTKKTV